MGWAREAAEIQACVTVASPMPVAVEMLTLARIL